MLKSDSDKKNFKICFEKSLSLLSIKLDSFSNKNHILEKLKIYSEYILEFRSKTNILRTQILKCSKISNEENEDNEDNEDGFLYGSVKKKSTKLSIKKSRIKNFWNTLRNKETDKLVESHKIYGIGLKEEMEICSNKIFLNESYIGGLVIEPLKKISKNVVVADFKSLFPLTIINKNIGLDTIAYWPEFMIYVHGKYYSPFDSNYIQFDFIPLKLNDLNIRQVLFFIKPHIKQSKTASLQLHLSKIRDFYKNKLKSSNLDKSEIDRLNSYQLGIKYAMNGVYGCTGLLSFCNYNLLIASSIATFARNTLFSTYICFEEYLKDKKIINNCKIIYGDTDSLFFDISNFYEFDIRYFLYLESNYKEKDELKNYYEEFNQEEFNETYCQKRFNINYLIQVYKTKQPYNIYLFLLKLDYFKEIVDSNNIPKSLFQLTKNHLLPFDNNIFKFIIKDFIYYFSSLDKNRYVLNQNFVVNQLNIENLIQPLCILKKKNYIGTSDDNSLILKGSFCSNNFPNASKYFMNQFWKVVSTQTKFLTLDSKQILFELFETFKIWSQSDLFINRKISKNLEMYKDSSININQLRKANELNLNFYSQDSEYSYSYFNYIFENGHFIGSKISSKKALEYKIERPQSNILLIDFVEQVKKSITQEDIEYFIKFNGSVDNLFQIQNYFFKFGINDLEIDRECFLIKTIGNGLKNILEILDENNILIDLNEYFNSLWKNNFGKNFIFLNNLKTNTNIKSPLENYKFKKLKMK